MNISFITTCKGRLSHLKETLPILLAAAPDEVILVDVSCPDGVSEWVRANNLPVKIVQLQMEGFHLSRARNIGAQTAKFPNLCFIDADIKVDRKFIPWIKQNWQPNTFALRQQKNAYDGIHEQGTVVCRATDFNLVGQYDQIFQGYGGEDHDLYEKLRRSGLRRQDFPAELISSLPHDDHKRMRFFKEKDKKISSIQNRLYAAAKRQILSLSPGKFELPYNVREKIMAQIEAHVKAWRPGQPFQSITLSVSKYAWLPEPFRMKQNLSIELALEEV